MPPPQVKLSAGFWIQERTETPDWLNWLVMKFLAPQVPFFHPAVLSDLSP